MTDATPPEPNAEPVRPETVQDAEGAQTSEGASGAEESQTPEVEFTKEPQPELPLAQRRLKAGITRNRIGLWIVVGGFALYMIITGIVGILTKAR
jgi:hypothetical protein